jgi:tape measure domain-containing protein
MAEERVDIVITDRIAPTIVPKLQQMAAASRAAAGGVTHVTAATRGVKAGAAQTATAVAGVGAAMNNTKKAAVSLGAVLRTMFLVYFAASAAKRILNIADSYQEMVNKLKVVVGSSEAAAYELDRLNKIATDTRSDLGATVKLYQRLALAMSGMEVTGRDVEKVVENVNRALILGGADTQEATAAVRQLSQAFNKGKADGDEFRSMMENAPILMDLVAQEIGVTRHQLLGMAEEGKITADVMFRAFSNTEEVSRRFNETTLTLGHSVTQLTNNLTIQIGKINALTRANRILATIISTVAKNADILTVSLIVLLTTVTVAKIGKLVDAFTALGASIKLALAGIGPIGWVVIGLTLAGGAAYILWQRLEDSKDEAAELVNKINELHGAADSPFTRMENELVELIQVYQKHDGALEDNLEIVRLQHDMQRQGLSLTRDQIAAMLDLISVERRYRTVADTVQDAYDSTIGAVDQYQAELEGLTIAYRQGYISQEMYRIGSMQIQADMKRAAMAMTEVRSVGDGLNYMWESMHLGILQLGADLPPVFQGIADTITQGLQQMTDGIGNLVAQWALFGKKMRFIDVFRQVVAQMISSLVSLAAQYIIVGIARRFAGFGESTVTTSAPGASVPTSTTYGSLGDGFGQHAPMFASGGYTGNIPTDQIAGAVHGREFVVNARATAQNRSMLENINAGRSAMPNIVINNNAPGVTVRTEAVSADEVRLIAEEAVNRRAGQAVARDLGNANSPVSRSMRQYTTASRKGA